MEMETNMAEKHSGSQAETAEQGDQPTTAAAAAEGAERESNIRERKVSWARLRRSDSLNMEAGNLSFNPIRHTSRQGSWGRTVSLAFQSIGVIYGDIGTSPLYVYASTFTEGIQNKNDILGVLSLIIYTVVLVPMIKYVFLVLWANDNGDGGTFALYSLICRYANVSLIPNDQPEDRELSNYRLDTPSDQLRRAQKIKEKLEKSITAKTVLFLATILGTSMVIGDGVLTPCISVLSAVGGINSLGQAICLWFLFITGIGLYNLFKHDVTVLRAFNPKYMVDYFRRNGKKGWVSLGGIVLCITGTEAMFADLGHFNVPAVQISFSGIVFPSLLAAYVGQAAYLSKFPDHVANTFYDSIPGPLYWPTFVVANAAAIIASQAMISGAFAIISQSLSLGCFPRVKVVHTSAKYEGQVYIPEINYLLMVACVIVTYGFKTTDKISHAYGIAVVAVMLITTCLVTLIMLVIWKTKIWLISLFFVVFMSVELVYFSSVLYKFTQGGYLPLAFSLALMLMMGVWHYAHQQRYVFELKNKVSTAYVSDLVKNRDVNRLPGIGLLYSELVQGIPPIFPHFISNIPSIHSVVVFVSIKSIPISKVALEERFLFRQLVENLKEYIRHEHFILDDGPVEQMPDGTTNVPHSGLLVDGKARRSSSSAVHVEVSLEQPVPPRVSSGSIQSFNASKSANSSNSIVAASVHDAGRRCSSCREQGSKACSI
ncbi:UNVERIFIED_CONTAM: Potassium transporter 5 [Sesamum calycinum]|uniref:Potassium transporter 5 n=1 Tax=Sesamum calycinum TaxID=2727403 RepID=A0AAW2PRY5_9LAMI